MNSRLSNMMILFSVIVMHAWITPALAATVPEAKPDKGLVVFYRTSKMGGAAIPVNVSHSSGVIGTLSNGSTFYKYLDPGEHTFWVRVISEDSVTVNIEAGKTYYVRGSTKMGVVVARPRLTQVGEKEARAALKKLK